MECEKNADKIKSLDRLLDDQIREFESGADRVCDPDLDKMMWELGDYENEAPVTEAEEFAEEAPVEESLIEKKGRFGAKKRIYAEVAPQEEILPGEEVVPAASMTPDSGKD